MMQAGDYSKRLGPQNYCVPDAFLLEHTPQKGPLEIATLFQNGNAPQLEVMLALLNLDTAGFMIVLHCGNPKVWFSGAPIGWPTAEAGYRD